MKFLALPVLALALLTAQSVVAAPGEIFISTCDVECVGPYNACSWAAIFGTGTKAECDTRHATCIKDCVAVNGVVPFVFKDPNAAAAAKNLLARTRA